MSRTNATRGTACSSPDPPACPACAARNPTGYLFCFNCNQPLLETAENGGRAEGVLDLVVSDEELQKLFDAILEKAYGKKQSA